MDMKTRKTKIKKTTRKNNEVGKIVGTNIKSAKFIQALRKKKKLSQIEFSNKLEISQSHLSKLENGTQEINMLIAVFIIFCIETKQ